MIILEDDVPKTESVITFGLFKQVRKSMEI